MLKYVVLVILLSCIAASFAQVATNTTDFVPVATNTTDAIANKPFDGGVRGTITAASVGGTISGGYRVLADKNDVSGLADNEFGVVISNGVAVYVQKISNTKFDGKPVAKPSSLCGNGVVETPEVCEFALNPCCKTDCTGYQKVGNSCRNPTKLSAANRNCNVDTCQQSGNSVTCQRKALPNPIVNKRKKFFKGTHPCAKKEPKTNFGPKKNGLVNQKKFKASKQKQFPVKKGDAFCLAGKCLCTKCNSTAI